MHGLAVYVKAGLPFGQDLSLENCRFLLMILTGFTSLSVTLLSRLTITFFVFIHSISSTIDEVISTLPSANVFVFGDFNAHHKGWQTSSGEPDIDPVNFIIMFLSQMTLLRWLTFLLQSLTVTLKVLPF